MQQNSRSVGNSVHRKYLKSSSPDTVGLSVSKINTPVVSHTVNEPTIIISGTRFWDYTLTTERPTYMKSAEWDPMVP